MRHLKDQRLNLNSSLLCALGGPGERLKDLEPLQMDGITSLVSLHPSGSRLALGLCLPQCLAVMTLATVGEAVEEILADLS